jgi:hypothetical protein
MVFAKKGLLSIKRKNEVKFRESMKNKEKRIALPCLKLKFFSKL